MEDQIEKELQELIGLNKEIDDLYHNIATRLGLSDSALDVLTALYSLGDGCFQAQICRQCYSSRQTINSSIAKMAREGLLYLEQGQGRQRRICLTGEGRRVLEEKIYPVAEMERAAFMELEDKERGELKRLTKKYADSLQRHAARLGAAEGKT